MDDQFPPEDGWVVDRSYSGGPGRFDLIPLR